MKFQLGSLLTVNTEDKYHPVALSDGLVNIFFFLTAGLHGVQAVRYQNSIPWLAYHSVCGALSAYWPFMIWKGYTHKGLGHASYGLAATVPHVTSLQVFGSVMVLDKIYNLGDLKLPNGADIFDRTKGPLNSYGTDNMLLDNMMIPKAGVSGLAVNIPWMTAMGVAELFGGRLHESVPTVAVAASLGAGVMTAKADWIDKDRPAH